MTIKPFLVNPALYDLDKPITDIVGIRKYNSQRFEMEQLTAIVYENIEEQVSVGYKDLTDKEFWVRGHMPDYPLMPGVIMCESAAQLASYFVTKYDLFQGAVMGFAGLEEVKFRGMVRPGDRFVVQASLLKLRRILVTARFMCLVDDNIVCEGVLKGVPLRLT
ncbi:MAG: 3-hydroxyacyl-ACP dehydratase FabZ family protein [Planctomycetia bacterium]|nr:3-hydroxyacyl-ACP dehydratase FabZ family protein [Planctomycetia bacterium]